MASQNSKVSVEDSASKTLEQQLEDAKVSPNIIDLIKRIATGSGQVSESDMKQLMMVRSTLPDVALEYLAKYSEAINAAVKSINAAQNFPTESVSTDANSSESSISYNPLSIADIQFIDKLPEGAQVFSIFDLFIKDMESIRDNWFNVWENLVENDIFLEVQSQDGKSQYCSPKMINEQVHQREGNEKSKLANIEDILKQFGSFSMQFVKQASHHFLHENSPDNISSVVLDSENSQPENSSQITSGESWVNKVQKRGSENQLGIEDLKNPREESSPKSWAQQIRDRESAQSTQQSSGK